VNVIRFFLGDAAGPGGGAGSEAAPGADAMAARRRPLVTLIRELFTVYFGIVRWALRPPS
jgi:hypothetical protein